MGGRIEVVSKTGEGSTFRFYIKASLSSNVQYSSQENLVLEDKSTDPNANKKVLIVEGEKSVPRTSHTLRR